MLGMVGFQRPAVGLHCTNITTMDAIANVTCRMTMPKTSLVRRVFGFRRLLMRIAMERLGKLKEAI